eukprot:1675060-Rhodomonas_salina.1
MGKVGPSPFASIEQKARVHASDRIRRLDASKPAVAETQPLLSSPEETSEWEHNCRIAGCLRGADGTARRVKICEGRWWGEVLGSQVVSTLPAIPPPQSSSLLSCIASFHESISFLFSALKYSTFILLTRTRCWAGAYGCCSCVFSGFRSLASHRWPSSSSLLSSVLHLSFRDGNFLIFISDTSHIENDRASSLDAGCLRRRACYQPSLSSHCLPPSFALSLTLLRLLLRRPDARAASDVAARGALLQAHTAPLGRRLHR